MVGLCSNRGGVRAGLALYLLTSDCMRRGKILGGTSAVRIFVLPNDQVLI